MWIRFKYIPKKSLTHFLGLQSVLFHLVSPGGLCSQTDHNTITTTLLGWGFSLSTNITPHSLRSSPLELSPGRRSCIVYRSSTDHWLASFLCHLLINLAVYICSLSLQLLPLTPLPTSIPQPTRMNLPNYYPISFSLHISKHPIQTYLISMQKPSPCYCHLIFHYPSITAPPRCAFLCAMEGEEEHCEVIFKHIISLHSLWGREEEERKEV